jgi:hypothetical protein
VDFAAAAGLVPLVLFAAGNVVFAGATGLVLLILFAFSDVADGGGGAVLVVDDWVLAVVVGVLGDVF